MARIRRRGQTDDATIAVDPNPNVEDNQPAPTVIDEGETRTITVSQATRDQLETLRVYTESHRHHDEGAEALAVVIAAWDEAVL